MGKLKKPQSLSLVPGTESTSTRVRGYDDTDDNDNDDGEDVLSETCTKVEGRAAQTKLQMECHQQQP